MASEHTPTPWEWQDPMGADIGFWIVQVGLKSYEWSLIASVHQSDIEIHEGKHQRLISKEEQKANTDFIVRACNSHDALVEALTELRQWIDGWSPDFICDEEWPETEEKVRAALSLAEAR